MTPQLYVKLTSQIARQTPEAEALEAQALALQPSVDSAQTWLDSCQSATDAAQATLTEAQAVEGADTTEQQAALTEAQTTLETAKTDLSKAKAPQDEATAQARQIRAAILECQAAIDVSGMTMTGAEIEATQDTAIKDSAWERIKTKRDDLKASGVAVAGKWFHSDPSSRIQQLGLVIMGAAIPSGLQWKTMDGSFVTMTPTLAGQIFQATAVLDMTMHAVAEQHKAGLYASAAPDAYNWRAGWPATFTG